MKRCKTIFSSLLIICLFLVSMSVNATDIEDQEEVIEGLEGEMEEVEEQKGELNDSINQLAEEMESLQADIDAKLLEIEAAEEELIEAQEIAADQYSDMKLRIAYMYENDNVSYLELLLSSEDMSDFLNKVEYVNNVVEYDREQLESYEATVDLVEENKAVIESESDALLEMQVELESKNEELNAVLEELNLTIADLEDEISMEQEKLEELVEAAEEAARQREAALEAAASGNKGASYVSGDGYFSHPIPDYTYISSDFGYRIHPISGEYKLHSGTDFAAPTGTPIYAADDGVVITASYSSSAGNWIIIDHGDGLMTVYMHNSKLFVSVGDTVTKGENIALCGSTGNSTGSHLHFGVKLNGEYVDPMPYL